MFKMSPASLQTFIDTPNCVLEDNIQYSTLHITNVFCDGHLQIINCIVLYNIHSLYSPLAPISILVQVTSPALNMISAYFSREFSSKVQPPLTPLP